LAETFAWFDIPQLKDDDLQAAIDSLRKAAEIDEPLVAQNPNVPEYALSYTHVCYKLGAIYWRLAVRQGALRQAQDLSALRQAQAAKGSNASEEAEAWTRRALKLQADIVQRLPDAPANRFWHAKIEQKLGQILRVRGELKESRDVLNQSIATLVELAQIQDAQPVVRKTLRDSYLALADTLSALGDKEGSQTALSKSASFDK
jgi:tetratricopeptide (TPR) repeat protein